MVNFHPSPTDQFSDVVDKQTEGEKFDPQDPAAEEARGNARFIQSGLNFLDERVTAAEAAYRKALGEAEMADSPEVAEAIRQAAETTYVAEVKHILDFLS